MIIICTLQHSTNVLSGTVASDGISGTCILYTHGRPNKGGPAAAARVVEKVRPRVHVRGGGNG